MNLLEILKPTLERPNERSVSSRPETDYPLLRMRHLQVVIDSLVTIIEAELASQTQDDLMSPAGPYRHEPAPLINKISPIADIDAARRAAEARAAIDTTSRPSAEMGSFYAEKAA